MKLLEKAGIGVLSLVLGIPIMMFAQDEPKREEPRPEPRVQDEAKPPKQEEVKPPKESKHSKQEEAKPSSTQQQGNTHATRPAGKSVHVPDNKFRANFGRAHTVVINRPVIVEGQPRFQSGGYWFIISDPWPAEWLYTDECYIDYVDDEYFLFDLLHPGVRIALVVVM